MDDELSPLRPRPPSEGHLQQNTDFVSRLLRFVFVVIGKRGGSGTAAARTAAKVAENEPPSFLYACLSSRRGGNGRPPP